jgi:hypothetical protein
MNWPSCKRSTVFVLFAQARFFKKKNKMPACNAMDGGLSKISFPISMLCLAIYSCGPSTIVGIPMATKALFVDGNLESTVAWAVSAIPIVGPAIAFALPTRSTRQ